MTLSSFTKENNYTPDVFQRVFDLSPSQMAQAQRFKILKMKENKTSDEIEEYNSLQVELQNHIITPELFNHFTDALMSMQELLRGEVYDYITDMQSDVKLYTDDKKLEMESFSNEKKTEMDSYVSVKSDEFNAKLQRFNHMGEYNAITQYRQWNTATLNGETYLALQDSINKQPNSLQDTEYWAKIASRGAQGQQGIAGSGLRFKGVWNPSVQFYTDDAVQYGGQLFACTQDNIGEEPDPNQPTPYWALAISKGQSTKVAMIENIVTVTNVTSNVPIGIPEFNSVSDGLMVIKNTTTLTKNNDYKVNANGSSIDCMQGYWDGSENPIEFHFIVFKNFVTDIQYQDGSIIQYGTIHLNSLADDAKPYISETPPLNPINHQIWIDWGV